jgi:uncharacterized SAM-binding protein YcdF (DUF218 family)
MDALAEFIKSLLIPGTLSFLLFGLTLGVLFAIGPRRTRRLGLAWLTLLALGYWLASVPVFAHLLATRFRARDAAQVTAADVAGAQAIVVLGAGIRNSFVAAGQVVTEPDRQTIFNAVEAARIYHLVRGGLPVIASGGKQSADAVQDSESSILQVWLVRAGVPPQRITQESGSRNTREQAVLVAPLLKAAHHERFVLVAPAVQLPRALTVFRNQGLQPIAAAAPFVFESERQGAPGWVPNGGALRISERATYDYLAWAYYWLRGWLA